MPRTRSVASTVPVFADQLDADTRRQVISDASLLGAPKRRRDRPAVRQAPAIESSTRHLGFRCVVRDPSR